MMKAVMAVGMPHMAMCSGLTAMPFGVKDGLHQHDGAERDEHVFAEEQADIVGSRSHGADAVAHLFRQRWILQFGCGFRHRRDQRPHHRRVAAKAGQAERGGQLAHEQVEDQEAAGGGGADLGDRRLRVFFQAEAFKQSDGGQRQQQDHRQVAGLDEGGAERGQDGFDRHRGGHAGDAAGGDYHQHWMRAHDETEDDDCDARKGPQVDC